MKNRHKGTEAQRHRGENPGSAEPRLGILGAGGAILAFECHFVPLCLCAFVPFSRKPRL